jgi:formamidopyrimidine-DNA glycosylase
MPELPEVETVRRTLEPCVGAKILGLWLSGKPLRMNRAVPRARLQTLVGSRIVAVARLGKYLLLETSGKGSLLVHLGMSGRLRLQAAGTSKGKHTHVLFELSGKRELHFSDPRRFGQVDLVVRGREREHPSLRALGPDPLLDGIDPEELYERSRGRSGAVKAFILSQQVIAGVGNIYAAEALWRCRLHPDKPAGAMTRDDARALAIAIDQVLRDSLENHGTSLKDFVDADGQEGSNREALQVYGRAGQPCGRCGQLIRRKISQGRATFFCPTCQLRRRSTATSTVAG